MHKATSPYLSITTCKSTAHCQMQRTIMRALFPGIVALICLACWGCSGAASTQKAAAATSRPTTVAVGKVRQQDLPVYLTGLGSVEASYTVTIKSRVDGQLVSVPFKEGQQVRKGELLAVID